MVLVGVMFECRWVEWRVDRLGLSRACAEVIKDSARVEFVKEDRYLRL